MPVPTQRDPHTTRQQLQKWFDNTSNTASGVWVNSDLQIPAGVGNANETVLFSVTYEDGVAPRCEQLVLRIAPTTYTVFMKADLGQMCALIENLATSVRFPVPEIRWFEPSTDILGAPFCIMSRAPGRVPTDNDPAANWVLQLPADQQQQLWTNGFRAMCSIHMDPGRGPAEEILRRHLSGRSGVEQQLDYWNRYRVWAGVSDERVDRIYNWLTSHTPSDMTTSLSWGDARLENLIFDNEMRCTAVLDWEMASLGGPLMDLGFWLNWDKVLANSGAPRPAGYSREAVLDLWDELTGIPLTGLAWYEVFAAYRLANVCGRIAILSESHGIPLDFDLLAPFVATAEHLVD
jgi:aminoglycoside phosphotransferase (APT) family kinase protein